jgi:hypothetical protein
MATLAGKTYLVATLARYVLVDAVDEAQARELGHTALYELYADLREKWGKRFPSKSSPSAWRPQTKLT